MTHKTQPSSIRDLFFEARAELSKDALSVKLSNEKREDLLILSLLCRITTHLRGIEALYAAELSLEADTILRSCLESLFWIGALIQDPTCADKMVNDHENKRQSMRRRLLNSEPWNAHLDDDTRRQMEEAQKEFAGKRQQFNVLNVSEAANLETYYNFYASLSNNAAHPSIQSLDRHVVSDDKGGIKYLTALVRDPDWPATFHLGCSIILVAKNILSERYTFANPTWEERFRRQFISISDEGA